MELLLGISDADIDTIRELRVTAEIRRDEYEKERYYEEKEKEHRRWCIYHDFFHRMEALIDNQLILCGQILPADTSVEKKSQSLMALEEHLEHDREVIKSMRKGLMDKILSQ